MLRNYIVLHKRCCSNYAVDSTFLHDDYAFDKNSHAAKVNVVGDVTVFRNESSILRNYKHYPVIASKGNKMPKHLMGLALV